MFSVGDLSQGSHLFPFRTEKLSLVEPMILHCGESRQSPAPSIRFFILQNSGARRAPLFCVSFLFTLLSGILSVYV